MIAPTLDSSSAVLRAATPRDLPAVEALLTASELPLAGVKEALDSFVVAESRGELVGVAGLEPCGSDALLRSVAVKPEWRSKGVGRALVTRAIADAESRGCRALYLLTTTADRYFPSFGFATIPRDQAPPEIKKNDQFTTTCSDTAILMSRELKAR